MVVSKLKVLREARQLRATRLNLMKRSRWDTETWGGGGGAGSGTDSNIHARCIPARRRESPESVTGL